MTRKVTADAVLLLHKDEMEETFRWAMKNFTGAKGHIIKKENVEHLMLSVY